MRTMGRLALTGIAICATATFGLVVAMPAQAVDVTIPACSYVDYRLPAGSTVTYPIGTGCILIFGGTARAGNPTITPSGPASAGNTVVVTLNSASDWSELSFTSVGSGSFEQWAIGCDVEMNFDYTGSLWTLIDYCPRPSESGPPDVLQQVAAPATPDCATTRDASLDIGGAQAGGWGRSWAQWVNGGNGGAVCTRTLTYDRSVQHYIVAP